MMRIGCSLRITTLVTVFCAVIFNCQAGPVDLLKVTISMFSGRPDPVYTISDSQSVSFIKRRLDHYNLRSDPGDANAPMPLENLGYRGVAVNESENNSIYRYYMSNGAAIQDYPQTNHRFLDRHSELEKMVLRLLKKELAIHPQDDSLALSLLPDSLTSDYSYSGFLTFEGNSRFSTEGMYVDISLLGNGSHYLVKNQDSVSAIDFSVIHTAGDELVIKSALGVAVLPQRLTGLQALGVVRPDSATPLTDTYRSALVLSGIKPETLTFKENVTSKILETTGTTFIIKTSENGYVAIVTAGRYIGGIDRIHFYYDFTTANTFSPVNQQVNVCSQRIVKSVIGTSQKRSTKVTLAGQKINTSMHVNQVILGQRIRIK
jgi:hypothetical protein